jgi:hypothetical protein
MEEGIPGELSGDPAAHVVSVTFKREAIASSAGQGWQVRL